MKPKSKSKPIFTTLTLLLERYISGYMPRKIAPERLEAWKDGSATNNGLQRWDHKADEVKLDFPICSRCEVVMFVHSDKCNGRVCGRSCRIIRILFFFRHMVFLFIKMNIFIMNLKWLYVQTLKNYMEIYWTWCNDWLNKSVLWSAGFARAS